MTSKLPGLAIYNPDILSKEDLLSLFVARRPLLDRLLSELRKSDRAGGPQHHLLIGPRGMGKTTLLRRLAYAIADDKQASRRWLGLVFPEEQYNVSRLSDFWANCLDALSDALEKQGRRAEAEAIDAALEAVDATDESARARATLDLLLGWIRKSKRGLVLLLDNVDLVLDRLKDHHWAIREVLSEENRLVLIGASSTAIGSTFEYGAAFYEFFKLDELRGLDENEAREVLLNLARARNTPRVADVIENDPGRFRTLHVLTGGNPRTLVLLYNVLALDSESDVYEDLERLLDQCTPLYKARFEELAPQAQLVVDALALNWDPTTAGHLAEKLRMEVNPVSAQLNRLVHAGVVEKVSLPGAAKTGFQMAERFFNIWYLMRASRRLRRKLIWLVEFLKMFYGAPELKTRAEKLLKAGSAEPHLAEMALAYAQALGVGGLRSALEAVAIEQLLTTDEKTRHSIEELLDLKGEDAQLQPVVDRMRTLREAEKKVRQRRRWPKGYSADRFWNALGGSSLTSLKRKAEVSNELQRWGDAEIIRFIANEERQEPFAFAREAVRCGYMENAFDVKGGAAASVKLTAPLLSLLPLFMICALGLPSSEVARHVHMARQEGIAVDFILIASLAMCASSIEAGDWQSVVGISESVLIQLSLIDTRASWEAVEGFFAYAIRRGHTSAAVEMLDATGLAERWRPLKETLGNLAMGGRDNLQSLAPEIRVVSEALFDRLIAPSPTSFSGLTELFGVLGRVPPAERENFIKQLAQDELSQNAKASPQSAPE